MQRIEIALAADENYRMGLLVTACSLAEHASRGMELAFHVLDGGLADETWARLETALHRLHPHVSLERRRVDDGLFAGLPDYHGSRMTYARLALPNILTDIDRCVYSDVDFLWLADVAELWREMRAGDLLCSVAEPCAATLDTEEAWCRRKGVPFHRSRYVCAGFSFYNLKRARETHLAERTIRFLNDHPDVPFVDQTALNAVLDGDVRLLDEKWERLTVALHGLPKRADYVLHFAGDAPWRFDAPAAILTDAAILWHRHHARYAGVSLYRSLRQCLSPSRMVVTRGYWHLIRCPLTRGPFFAFLRLLGHRKCPSVMRSKCL